MPPVTRASARSSVRPVAGFKQTVELVPGIEQRLKGK